jgi:hypothetical protein
MPYYKRASQLHNTLTSFLHYYANRDDYEVVIVADGKNAKVPILDSELRKVVDYFKTDIPITLFQYSESVINPSVLFNKAFELRKGDILIITNPECFHKVDILSGLDKEFEKSKFIYVVCACESSKVNSRWISKFEDFKYDRHMWYQHSEYRNACYHFCTVMTAGSYALIGGFDEMFAKGLCFDDDDFRDRVRQSGMKFVIRDDLVVVHQKHDKDHLKMKGYRQLWLRNKQLYERTHHVKYQE